MNDQGSSLDKSAGDSRLLRTVSCWAHPPLRGGTPPSGKCPVVGILDPHEVVMGAALVGVVAFRQEQERPLRGPGVFFRRVAAQPLEALPVKRLFVLLLALLRSASARARSCCAP